MSAHKFRTVHPPQTSDDWIDPAVRLPEVGEWFWYDYGDGDISAYVHVDGDRDWRPGSRWAPILVGPPPIPDADAPDDQAAMYQTARARAEAISPNPEFIERYMARWLHLPTTIEGDE